MSETNREKYEWLQRSHQIADAAEMDFTFRVRSDPTAEYTPVGSLDEAVSYLRDCREGEIMIDFKFTVGEEHLGESLHFMNDLDPHLKDEEKKEYLIRQIKVKVADAVYHQKYPV